MSSISERPRRPVSLGEVVTPLLEAPWLGAACQVKLDHLLPTGSYKDRGAGLMVSRLRELGVSDVVDDSSGNAGAALAGYAAAGGLSCTVYVPAGNSAPKQAQASAYGAHVVAVDGDRQAVAEAARGVAGGRFYASHNLHPLFLEGVASLGLELWEQRGFQLPDHVVVPCGHGSLVLALARAFEALLGPDGSRWPRIHAIQTAAYPAVRRAWSSGAGEVAPAGGGPTLAEGVACRHPVRGRAVLTAIRRSRGTVTEVTDAAIAGAFRRAARAGICVEPTSACAVAGCLRLMATSQIDGESSTVVVLTGSGLKTGPDLAHLSG